MITGQDFKLLWSDPTSLDNSLTHLSRMDFPTLISRTRPFSVLGLMGGILLFFSFSSNFNRTYC